MRLADLEDAFARMAVSPQGDPPPSLLALQDRQTLLLYRSLVQFTLSQPLEQGFPCCRKVLGEEVFEQLRRACLAAYPPQHWDLNALGEALVAFLEDLPSEASALAPSLPAYLAELADYERQELEVYLAPDEPGIGPLAVNPSLRIRVYEHDIAGWVKATEGLCEGEPASGQTFTLIFRHPDHLLCRFLTVDPLTAGLLAELQQGQTVELVAAGLARLEGLPVELARPRLEARLEALADQGVLWRHGGATDEE